MEFGYFQKKIVEGLQEIYGDSVELDTDVVKKNNGRKYNGILIRVKDSQSRTDPIVDLDSVYEAFKSGRMDMEECIREVYRQREDFESNEEIERFAESAMEWELVKDDIYPILLSTEENKELLEKLVSTPMLDLSVVYTIRRDVFGKDTMSIKITKKLLECYGISVEQLHRQAMANMEKDGYEFLEMESLLGEILLMRGTEEGQGSDNLEMYILTNSARSYGAAGILNKEMLREFAGSRNFIILPSSQHETIFVPVTDKTDKKVFDEMVFEVNRTQVSVEERLADHSYYYDAESGEVRMCA